MYLSSARFLISIVRRTDIEMKRKRNRDSACAKRVYTAPAVYEQDRRSANSEFCERIPNNTRLVIYKVFLLNKFF